MECKQTGVVFTSPQARKQVSLAVHFLHQHADVETSLNIEAVDTVVTTGNPLNLSFLMLHPQLAQHLSVNNGAESAISSGEKGGIFGKQDDKMIIQQNLHETCQQSKDSPSKLNSTFVSIALLGPLIGWITVRYGTNWQKLLGENFGLMGVPISLVLFAMATVLLLQCGRKPLQQWLRRPNLLSRIEENSFLLMLFYQLQSLCYNTERCVLDYVGTARLRKLSQVLGTMGAAPLLASSSPDAMDAQLRDVSHCPAIVFTTLLRLISSQSDFMAQCHSAIRLLQACSRWVALPTRQTQQLPLPLFRQRLQEIIESNLGQIERLLVGSTVATTNAIPTCQHLRHVLATTLQLLSPMLCEQILLHYDPTNDVQHLNAARQETERKTEYVKGLIASVMGITDNQNGIVAQASELHLLLVAAEHSNSATMSSDDNTQPLWERALSMARNIVDALEEQCGSSEDSAEENAPVKEDAVVDPSMSETLHGESKGTRCVLPSCSAAPAENTNETLIYSAQVGEKKRPRRRRVAQAIPSTPSTTPFDFVAELQLHLQTLAAPPEVEVE